MRRVVAALPISLPLWRRKRDLKLPTHIALSLRPEGERQWTTISSSTSTSASNAVAFLLGPLPHLNSSSDLVAVDLFEHSSSVSRRHPKVVARPEAQGGGGNQSGVERQRPLFRGNIHAFRENAVESSSFSNCVTLALSLFPPVSFNIEKVGACP